MSNLKQLRLRIKSVKSTKKITKAMQMVAASRLKKAREALEASKIYNQAVRESVSKVILSCDSEVSEFAGRILNGDLDVYKPALIILFSSDKGLCGSFNQSVFKKLEMEIDTHEFIKIMAIGKRAIEYVNAYHPDDMFAEYYFSEIDDEKLTLIANEISEKIENNMISSCDIIYNHFKNMISNETSKKHILPLDEFEQNESDNPVEVEGKDVLDKLLKLYILSELRNAANHSRASEESSRTTAMDNATKNAGELIDKLTLAMNRKRQSIITGELIEIISGAEAV